METIKKFVKKHEAILKKVKIFIFLAFALIFFGFAVYQFYLNRNQGLLDSWVIGVYIFLMIVVLWGKLFSFSLNVFDNTILRFGWLAICLGLLLRCLLWAYQIWPYPGWAMLVSGIIVGIVYVFCPVITFFLGLEEPRYSYYRHKLNGSVTLIGLAFIFSYLNLLIKINDDRELQNAKEFSEMPFEKVENFFPESIRGTTYYVVTTPTRWFYVNPQDFPQVRKAAQASKTEKKVKAFPKGDGVFAEKFEIY